MKKEDVKDPAQAIDVAVFQAGEQIFPPGYESPYFLVILSGQVVLTRNGKRIRTLGEQDIFGLESLSQLPRLDDLGADAAAIGARLHAVAEKRTA